MVIRQFQLVQTEQACVTGGRACVRVRACEFVRVCPRWSTCVAGAMRLRAVVAARIPAGRQDR